MADEIFFPIADEDQWKAFWAVNSDALADEIGDEGLCHALACNCELIIGGGAAQTFRVGFVDE
jgi:hypothetical protein